MGEVLLYSILFLSRRQIPSLLGDMAYQLCDELYNWLCWSCATRQTDVSEKRSRPWREGIIKVRTFAGTDLRLFKPRSLGVEGFVY